MNQEPLIWTTKGNLPLSQLTERVSWTDSADETVCVIEHWLGEECVKRQPNVLLRRGFETSAVGGTL